MARAAPKSKKGKPAPKSKKVEEKEPDVTSEEERDEKVDTEEEEEKPSNSKNGNADESDGEEEPPSKRGRPSKGKAGKKTPAKKAGRPASKARKTPAKKAESESEDDEKEYEVQTILDERTKKSGSKEYLVQWKGYTKAKSTWEPEANLNCDEAIAAFQEKLKKAKEIPAKELREGRKQTERYAEIAGSGQDHKKRHSRRNAKSPRKTYREAPDSD